MGKNTEDCLVRYISYYWHIEGTIQPPTADRFETQNASQCLFNMLVTQYNAGIWLKPDKKHKILIYCNYNNGYCFTELQQLDAQTPIKIVVVLYELELRYLTTG